jgi:response regulator RpfG family c-di-GMP phosphodiesterase
MSAAPPTSRPRVLFVDDEPDFLAAITRSLRSSQFEVSTAGNGASALETLQKNGPFAVLVSDLKMPGMGGVELLRQAHRIAPDTCRVLFTGHLDIENALAAVNDGAIFRFIVKPCAIVVVAATIKAAAEQYRLVTAERVLLEQTLRGSVQALADVLALASPMAFGRATRLRKSVSALAAAMHIDESWHVEIAAMLSQMAYVTLPPETLEKVFRGEPLNEREQAMIARLPTVTEQVLNKIPRLEPVLEILRYSEKHFDGSGTPAGGLAGEELPWGARALKIIFDLDAIEKEWESAAQAFDILRAREGWYDPAILKAYAEIQTHQRQPDVRDLPLESICPGMILDADIKTKYGVLYMARGQEITASGLEKLKNWSMQVSDLDTVRVQIRNGRA